MLPESWRRAEVHLALAAVALFFSLNYIIGKIGLRHFDPFAFAWLRVAGSALVLQLLLRLRRVQGEKLSRDQMRPMIVSSILGVGINQLMFLKGLSLTSAHEAAILITSIPIFTLLGAIAMKSEKATWPSALGIVLAALGALLIIGLPAGSGEGANRVAGDVMILINCCSFGLYLVVSRQLSRERSAILVISWLFGLGAVLMLPFCLKALLSTRWNDIPGQAWLALAGVIAGPTVGAYVLNAWALGRAESSAVAAYTYLQPFLATLMAAAFLGERLSWSVFAAAGLIIAGVALSTLRRGEAKKQTV